MIRNQDLYQSGRAYWVTLRDQYGVDAANRAAAAAATGDLQQLNNVLSDIARASRANPGQDVTNADISSKDAGFDTRGAAEVFLSQMASDPLAAPLESANKVAANSFFSFLKAPFVLLALAVVAFFMLGGSNVLRKQLAKLK